MPRAAKPISDLLGGETRFGRLTFIRETDRRAYSEGGRTKLKRMVLCRCDCGGEIVTLADTLHRHQVQSCGCIRTEHNRAVAQKGGDATRTHGMSRTSVYYSWTHMRSRCLNPEADNYERYGGRGIKICPQWVDDFDQFYADMGDRPKGTTLDRIEVDGDYQPSNCRWATPKVQQANQRRHKQTGI